MIQVVGLSKVTITTPICPKSQPFQISKILLFGQNGDIIYDLKV